MSSLKRFSVSLPGDLLEKFDQQIEVEHYPNRSKAIGDLIRENLVKGEWKKGKEVAGAIIVVYDHHKRELAHTMMSVQHDYHHEIVSTQHIHLDHDNCLEIIAVKGNSGKIQELANKIKALKGVKHSSLTAAAGTDAL